MTVATGAIIARRHGIDAGRAAHRFRAIYSGALHGPHRVRHAHRADAWVLAVA